MGTINVDNIKNAAGGKEMSIADGHITVAADGKVGIGTTAPEFPIDIEGNVADDAVSTVLRISADDPSASGEHAELQIKLGNGVSSTATRRVELHALSADGTENRNIIVNPSGGAMMVGTTTTSAATDQGIILNPTSGLHMNNSTSSSGISLILLYSSHSSTDQTKFEVTSEGNVKSRTNSYAGFSDERLKEQIVDASSQWDDIKAIEIKNFKFISNLDDADNPKMLGVIAQQVEKVSPNLVEVDPKDDMKTVKYSLLYLKSVKALQEAMARIETLEAEIVKLKG